MSFGPFKKSLRRRAVRSTFGGFSGLEPLESRVMLSATLQFTPSSGTVTTENGQEVVTVAPGTAINFTAALANGSDASKSFQLDFSNSDPSLALSSWTTNGTWTTKSDSTLGVGDSVVSASNGSALTAPTLGTFTVTAPSTPGDYPLTANADTIFSGSLYYTLFINRVKEAIEEGPFQTVSIDGFPVTPTSVNVVKVNGEVGTQDTEVDNQDYQNIFKISYTYDPVTQIFTTGTPQFIAQTLGADGITQANGGADLLIGGQANQVFEVPSGGGTVQTANLPSGESFHLSLDPTGTSIWTSDEPGNVLVKVPLSGFGSNITTLNVTGDEVTQLGFAPALTAMGNFAYYTKSNRDGGAGDDGSWGIINLTTGVATPVQSNIDGPHSIVFDSYTGDMMMYGDHTITQVDISNPMNPTVVSTLDVSSELNAVAVNLKFTGTATGSVFGFSATTNVTDFDTGVPLSVLDQGAVDGFGHAFIAANSGYTVVLDYASSNPADRLVGNATVALDPGTGKLPFVAEYLDDFSPVVNPTSQGGTILTAGDNSGISISNFGNVIVRVAAPVLPTVTIAAPDAAASESGNNTGTITVTRTGATDAALPVSYTIGGTATNGTDYSTITGSVTIPIGQLSANITITPVDQHIVGGSKTAVLTLSTDPTYTIGDTSAATVTIADNDQPAPVLSASAEITAQQLEFTLLSVGDPQAPRDDYTIALHNTGTTTIGTFWYAWTPGKDFMPDQPTNITSPPGWTDQVTHIGSNDGYAIQWTALTPDADLAPGDSLTTFQFDSAATPAQIAGNSQFYPDTPVSTSFVYIGQPELDPGFQLVVANQFDLTPPSVTINQAQGQADPATTSPINFTVVFSKAVTDFATGDVSFTGSTVSGTLLGTVTQVAPNDGTTYSVAVSGMTSSGAIVATIAAAAAHDATGNANTASTSTDHTVTFNQPLPVVTIAATDPNASESTLDTGTFTVTRTGPTDAALQVFYGVGGTATDGTDDVSLPGSVTIPTGQSSAPITVTPIDAHIVGGSKTVMLTLSDNDAYTVGDAASDTVTIADNDLPPPAPDLTINFDQPVSLPDVLVPGDVNTLSGEITNIGTLPTAGSVRVDVYLLPADQFAPVIGTDTSIGSVTVKGPFTLNVNKPVKWKAKTTVPGNLDAGSYHFVAVMDTTNLAIPESDTTNDAAALAPMMLDLEFGTIPNSDHKVVKTLTVDGITYSYSGPGVGTITRGAQDSIQITGATAASSLTAKIPKNAVAEIQNVTVAGSAKSLDFTGITLGGNVTVSGLLTTLKLGNVADNDTIEIDGAAVPKAAVSITAANVQNLSINSTIPIKAIAVNDWEADETPGTITAPSIGTITSKANFAANVTVTDVMLKTTLTGVSVKGILSSLIRSTGSIASISAGRIVDSVILVATVNPALVTMPTIDADFVAGSTASVVKVTATGIKNDPDPSFVGSVIAGPSVGTVTLKDVTTANGGVTVGVAARIIKSYSSTGLKEKNLTIPNDYDALDDFVLRIV